MGNAFQPHRFGRYLLTERIGKGGMAEIFRAKIVGALGFEKSFVVKRILPQFAQDKAFVAMLVTEAKLVCNLEHPNIVQVLELGEVDGQYFITMEHVDGIDASQLWRVLHHRGQRLPAPLALYIVGEFLKGLDYAHRAMGPDGRLLGVVHRDVSPSNVLLSFRGDVKIGDFGIAHVKQESKTHSGVLKGKYGYLAPEQVAGLTVDQRSDVFAAGIVLTELLLGRRLFLGASDFETMHNVLNVRLHVLEQHVRSLPPPVVEIARRALQQEPIERWPSAGDFQLALADYLYAEGIRLTSDSLAAFLAEHVTPFLTLGEPPPSRSEPERELTPRPVERRLAPDTPLGDPPAAELDEDPVTARQDLGLEMLALEGQVTSERGVRAADPVGFQTLRELPAIDEQSLGEGVISAAQLSGPRLAPVDITHEELEVPDSPRHDATHGEADLELDDRFDRPPPTDVDPRNAATATAIPPAPPPRPPAGDAAPGQVTRSVLASPAGRPPPDVPERAMAEHVPELTPTPSGRREDSGTELSRPELAAILASGQVVAEPGTESARRWRVGEDSTVARVLFELGVAAETGVVVLCGPAFTGKQAEWLAKVAHTQLDSGSATDWSPADSRTCVVQLEGGQPTMATADRSEETLVAYLARVGVLRENQLAAALRKHPQLKPVAAVLAAGLIVPLHLSRHITSFVIWSVLESFNWTRGELTFLRGGRCPAGAFPTGYRGLELVAKGVSYMEERTLDELRARHAARIAAVELQPRARLDQLGADAVVIGVYRAFAAPRSLEQGLADCARLGDRTRIKQALHLLLECGFLQLE